MAKGQTFLVKSGLSTLDQMMTRDQAIRHGNKNMHVDLRRAGFETVICQTDAEIHGGVWLRINYGKK